MFFGSEFDKREYEASMLQRPSRQVSQASARSTRTRSSTAMSTASTVTEYITETVEIFECERWYPIRGYCNKLLPTDRGNWVSRDMQRRFHGREELTPQAGWAWIDDWHIDNKFEPCDKDGWQYAVDFASSLSSYSSSSTARPTRRRRWIRTKRGPK